MNKLIRGACWSPRAAREQRIRESIRDGHGPHGDVRSHQDTWSRAAQALHRHDPNGIKLAELLKEASQ